MHAIYVVGMAEDVMMLLLQFDAAGILGMYRLDCHCCLLSNT